MSGWEQHLQNRLQSVPEYSGSRILGLTTLSGGCINHAARIETDRGFLVAKWNHQAPPDLFAREAQALRHLREADCGLVVPQAILLSDPGETPSFICLEYLEPAQKPPQRADWEALGSGLATLHQKQAKAFGFFHDNYLGATPQSNSWTVSWPEFYTQHRIAPLIKALTTPMDVQEKQTAQAFLKNLPALLNASPKPSLIHGDLWSGNFFFSTGGPAIIDPAAYFADREAELAMMLLFGGFPETVFSAYHEHYALPSDWKQRVEIHQLLHLLNHALLFGGGYRRQAWQIMAKFA